MNKGMMWTLVIFALVVGVGIGFYAERMRATQKLEDVKMMMQTQIDEAKKAAMKPTGVMMQSSVVMMAKAGYATDPKGMSLYFFDKDSANKSNCTGTCATTWPPYTTTESPTPMPEHLGVITRVDGTMQYTWDSKPLYYYSGDKKAGDTTGDGIGGVWHLAK